MNIADLQEQFNNITIEWLKTQLKSESLLETTGLPRTILGEEHTHSNNLVNNFVNKSIENAKKRTLVLKSTASTSLTAICVIVSVIP